MDRALEEVIKCITEDSSYIKYLEIRKQMNNNKELLDLIEEVKKLQKKYIRSNNNSDFDNLNKCKEQLEEIPIYVEYIKYLDIINNKIEYVKDELNDYFYNVINS